MTYLGQGSLTTYPGRVMAYQHKRFNTNMLVSHNAITNGIHITGTAITAMDPSTTTRVAIKKVCRRFLF